MVRNVFMKWSDDGRLDFIRKNGFRDGKIDESCYGEKKGIKA